MQHMENVLKEYVIALTGGIATGKTTVAEFLRRQGFIVIDADQLSRQVVSPGSEGLGAIVREFGSDILDSSGSLDRAKLRGKIFADPQNSNPRLKLESITHPLIRQLLVETVAKKRPTQKDPYPIFYEAALIFESKSQQKFKEIWVTACSPENQLRRLMTRNKLSEVEAQKIIASQFPMDEKVRGADRVIWTDEPAESYLQKLKPILNAIKQSALSDTSPGDAVV
jgi:dephospho-CoA kinase